MSQKPATGQTATAKPRITYLDTAKGLAIISVVLLHLTNETFLFNVLAPWHIWQAMPIFLMVAGITGNMVWKKYKGNYGAYYRDLPGKILPLYIPYAVVVTLYYMISAESLSVDLFFNTMLLGYLGPGGYFVPLIVTHLLVFPLVLSIRGKVGSDLQFLGAVLVLNIALEALFAFCDVDSTKFMYRIFYFRYLFGCCLGAVLAENNPFSGRLFGILAVLSAVYMAFVCYGGSNLPFIRTDGWHFQHYPAYFYTAFLVFSLVRDHEQRIPLLNFWIRLGKSSYDIFIFQLFFFITLYPYLNGNVFTKTLALVICLGGGLGLTYVKAVWAGWQKLAR